MNETRALSEFAATTTLADLPPEVVHRTKQVILDQLGCEVAGSQLPWNDLVYRAILGLAGGGSSPVVVFGDRLPADEAAFVNSAFGHGGDFDEATLRTHPGTVVVPAALALCALDDAIDGERLLVAISVGCEVMLRLADASLPALKDVRFHNTASSLGPFGAAAASAHLFGLDATTTEAALAAAAYQSAGLMQHQESGGSARRLQTAIGSKSGVRGAWLARAGMTGPAEILEGKRGFLESFAGDYDLSRLTDGLGSRFLSLYPTLKRFSMKYHIHSTVDGLTELVAAHNLSFDRIADIRVGVSESTRAAYGVKYEPSQAPDASAAMQAAEFSIRFAVSVVAKFGPAILSGLTPAQFNDPEVLDLARRMDVYRETDLDREPWMSWGSVVSITTTEGETYTARVPRPVGSPENPMQDADVEEKFHRLADPVIGTEKSATILSSIWQLEKSMPSIDVIPHLLLES